MLRRMSRIAAVCVLVLAQGCSLIFVNGPPDAHERLRYFDCVSNGAGPAGDASWAIFDGLIAASAASADGGDSGSAGTVAAVFGVAAAIHAGSMVYGLVQTNHCSDAKQFLQQRIMDDDNEQRRRIEELERQLRAQQAPVTPAAPRTLELAPAPEPGPVPANAPPVTTTEIPPPPGAYTQPAPSQPAPVQPAPAQAAPAPTTLQPQPAPR
jgi:hypothetical protein